MSPSPSRLIADDIHDQQCLTATALIISLNEFRYHSVIERVRKLQDMLILQQGHLHIQHLHLLALEQHLKRQELKLSQSYRHLEP